MIELEPAQRSDVGSASASGIRSLIVSIGPSLLADAIVAFSTGATLTRIVRRNTGRTAPAIKPITWFLTLAPWIYLTALRSWVLHWGATPGEVGAELPGDDIVPQPAWQSTRAIDIDAPVEAVWPWLAQMGQDRAGLYSYDWLENLAGLEFHNADRIVPEWQHVQVADIVRFAPKQDTLVVSRVEPNRYMVWRVLNPSTHKVADA